MLLDMNQEFYNLKQCKISLTEAIVTFELILLRELNFNVNYVLPYHHLVVCLKDLYQKSNLRSRDEQKVAQCSLAWLNDLMLCPIVLKMFIDASNKATGQHFAREVAKCVAILGSAVAGINVDLNCDVKLQNTLIQELEKYLRNNTVSTKSEGTEQVQPKEMVDGRQVEAFKLKPVVF